MRKALLWLTLALTASPAARAQYAADAYHDKDAMERARHAMHHERGGQTLYFLQAERFEYQSSGAGLFEGQGWVGGDYQRFWVKTEAEYEEGGRLTEGEIQGLYSRPVSPLFDFQAGVRQDVAPGTRRTFGVVGVQGLAPYWFELDASLFVSHEGDVSARLEAEYELRFTQRLILQPRAELNFAVQEVEKFAIGAGLNTAELGMRLRYEIRREFAPYVGVSWTRAAGGTADLWRQAGEDPSRASLVAGLRLWF